ncbi:MAG TPA: hypothetical protein VMX97_10845 [Hyphomicrobiaceae bacterium]|nr:hypothetical protein [Hyphomicrobiaceae bacterium]
MRKYIRAAILAYFMLQTLPASADSLGNRPAYTSRELSAVANREAITKSIWAPGIDDGYVPQGITFIEGGVYMSAYLSTTLSPARGPCRVYRLDPATGAVTSTLDLPSSCGHAGGLARGPARQLFVADTRHLYLVQLAKPNSKTLGRIDRTMRLAGDVKGSFAAGQGPFLWLGTYRRDGDGRLYKFSAANLPEKIDETSAVHSLPLPLRSQGATFDHKGRLWVSQSSGGFGSITILDPTSGDVLKRYETAIGVEDLSFDKNGQLWTVSEAGSIRWSKWHQFFPVIYRLDVSKLK